MFPRSNQIWHRPKAALTLLELLVVLTILIALGGIVVSSLPGLLERTQAATGSANVSEIDSAIRRGLLSNQGIGNRFDSLIVGTSGGQVAAYLGGVENFESTTLTAKDITALSEIGITELVPASEVLDNVTFTSHVEGAQPLGPESRICMLSPEYAGITVFRLWNLEPTSDLRYLVFGLGQRSTLVGASSTLR